MNTDRQTIKNSPGTEPAPASILTLVTSGEKQGMATLYDQYSGLIYSIALRVLRDPAAAEDVLHEVLMQVWRTPDSFSSEACLGVRLALAARNSAVQLLRRSPRGATGRDIPCSSAINLADEAQRTVLREKALSALAQLPREQSRGLAMAFFDGLPPSDIAALTGASPAAVKQRIRTALLAVRKAVPA